MKILILIILFVNCQSEQIKEKKLDFSDERKIIQSDSSMDEEKKNIILESFDYAEEFSIKAIREIQDLKKIIEQKEILIMKLDEQAKIYRLVRNILISILIGSILFYFRGFIFSIIKKVLVLVL
jgi:hypothetical protein